MELKTTKESPISNDISGKSFGKEVPDSIFKRIITIPMTVTTLYTIAIAALIP
jgi:hypothetical protein